VSQPAPSNRGKSGGAAAAIALAAGLVAYYEGYVPHGYSDPVGIPTVCYGHTGPEVKLSNRYTMQECKALLSGDLAKANAIVRNCIHVPMTVGQEAAFTSGTFNAGARLVCGSTLQRLANAGDMTGACAQLSRWVYARGVKLNGLVKRRAAEKAMCMGSQNE